jgi:hypothetical protein
MILRFLNFVHLILWSQRDFFVGALLRQRWYVVLKQHSFIFILDALRKGKPKKETTYLFILLARRVRSTLSRSLCVERPHWAVRVEPSSWASSRRIRIPTTVRASFSSRSLHLSSCTEVTAVYHILVPRESTWCNVWEKWSSPRQASAVVLSRGTI